jgi:hypothetical protein
MSPRKSGAARKRELDRESARYREAASMALEQLEWAIGYLRKIRRLEIAAALERNRRRLRRALR